MTTRWADTRGAPGSCTAARIPQTDSPYPAIYLNTHFSLGINLNGILLHEAGHNLGLVSRSTHARGGHCLNWGCLMGTHVDYVLEFRWLPGMGQSRLCPECVAELKQHATQPPPVNLRFVGPVLVRSETGYHVLSLPGDRDRLLVGDQTGEVIEKAARRSPPVSARSSMTAANPFGWIALLRTNCSEIQ